MFFCLGLFALALTSCVAQSAGDEATVCLWQNGSRREIEKADEIAAISLRLLNSAQDVSLLIVDPDLVDSVKNEDSALEISWPDSLDLELISGYKGGITRIFIPLSGEYRPADGASYLIFYGTQKGYITPPVLNHNASGEFAKIEELLKR